MSAFDPKRTSALNKTLRVSGKTRGIAPVGFLKDLAGANYPDTSVRAAFLI
jgi:hypothetical protein